MMPTPPADLPATRIEVSDGAPLPPLALRTSVLYAALYLHYGFFLLMPLWLAWQGATPGEIGTLLAVPLVLRLLTVAPVADWAGRHRRVRSGIAATALLAALLVVLLPMAQGPAQRFAIVVAFSIVWDQIPVLVDAYASMAVRAQSLDFGRLRVWGSIAVVVSTATAGWAVGRAGIAALPTMIAALLLLTPAATLLLPGDRRLAQGEGGTTGGWRRLFADRALIGAMAAASLVMGSHGVVNTFGALQWQADGIDPARIGLLNATAVGSEIVVFTLGGAVLAGRDPRLLILLSAVAAALRWAIMAAHPALPLLFVTQALQGLSSTGPLLAPMMMIARRVPAPLAASAQGLNAVFIGAVLAAVTAGSGLVWNAGPSRAYLVMAGIALLAPLAMRAGGATFDAQDEPAAG